MNTPYHFLTQTATVYPGQNSAGNGNVLETSYATANEATVRCRLFPVTSSEAMQYMRAGSRVTHKLLLAPVDSAGTAVTLGSSAQVVIGGVRYHMDGDAVGRAPGIESNKLIRAMVFRET